MKDVISPALYRGEEFDNLSGIHITENRLTDGKPHRHDFWEFDCILDGEGVCTVNGKDCSFKSGDIFFLTPLDCHCYKPKGLVRIITIHFQPDNISAGLSELLDIGASFIKSSEELVRTVMTLYRERNADRYAYFIRRNLLERMVLLFLHEQPHSIKAEIPYGMMYAVGYINRNFSENIDLEKMSGITGWSPSYFCRRFKRFTGMSLVMYLTDIRIQHAANLITSSSMSMTQVSSECGFGDVRSFNRAFRKKYGCTPREYKKRHSIK